MVKNGSNKFFNIECKFIKFLLVGVINTIFGYSVFALLIFVGLHYTLSALFSTVAGVLFNFKTTGLLVFESRNNLLIFRFITVYGFIYIFNIIILKIFNSYEINMYVAGAIPIFPMAVIAYHLNKHFVFNR